jgi:branched-chain amino acid transport system substrate-binding protein
MERAADFAVAEINERGGVTFNKEKIKVELIKEDDHGKPEQAVNAARELIYKEEVDAVIGPQFSSNAIPVAQLAEEAEVVMIAPMSTHPDTTKGKDYVFRIPFTDTAQARAMAHFARRELGYKRIPILYNISDEYCRGLATEFKKAFAQMEGIVPSMQTYTFDANRDFSEQIQKIKQQDPEALYLPNYTVDVEKQVIQAREMGLSVTMLGGDGWSDQRFKTIKAFEGSYSTRHWHPSIANEKAKKLINVHQEKYDQPPDDVFLNTYDAFSLLYEAIRNASSYSSEAIRNAITSIKEFHGASGTFYYEDSGDPQKRVIIVKIEYGKAPLYKIMKP